MSDFERFVGVWELEGIEDEEKKKEEEKIFLEGKRGGGGARRPRGRWVREGDGAADLPPDGRDVGPFRGNLPHSLSKRILSDLLGTGGGRRRVRRVRGAVGVGRGGTRRGASAGSLLRAEPRGRARSPLLLILRRSFSSLPPSDRARSARRGPRARPALETASHSGDAVNWLRHEGVAHARAEEDRHHRLGDHGPEHRLGPPPLGEGEGARACARPRARRRAPRGSARSSGSRARPRTRRPPPTPTSSSCA